MSKHIFKVQLRNKTKNNKQLRRENTIPANIYGVGEESRAIQCRQSDFVKLYNEIGDTGLVYLQSDDLKKEVPALISEIQHDSITNSVLHVAFHKVNLKEKIVSEIPIEFIGEVDIADTVLVHVRDSVEVEALPTDLPEKIVVDVSELTEIGQSITLVDLKFDKEKVTLIVGEEGETAPVVILQEVKEEVVEEPEVAVEDEEAESQAGEEKKEGGENPAKTGSEETTKEEKTK